MDTDTDRQGHGKDTDKDMDKYTARTQTRTRKRTGARTWNWKTFATYPCGTIVPIAPYGLLITHHSGNSNGAINL
jgi:hypothetical protein